MKERFIFIPIVLQDKNLEKLDLDVTPYLKATAKINPYSIEAYYETVPARLELRPENKISTCLIMKSGTFFILPMTLEKFEQLLDLATQENK